jgi:hypothetical protein
MKSKSHVFYETPKKSNRKKQQRYALGVVGSLLVPHLALLRPGGYHQCVVRVRERSAPNAGSAWPLLAK